MAMLKKAKITSAPLLLAVAVAVIYPTVLSPDTDSIHDDASTSSRFHFVAAGVRRDRVLCW